MPTCGHMSPCMVWYTQTRLSWKTDHCLGDSYLDNELYLMEMEQELLDVQDDDNEEGSDDSEVEDEQPVNFGLAAWLILIKI